MGIGFECCCTCGTLTATFKKCPSGPNYPGVSVTLLKGGVAVAGPSTTDASGQVVFTFASAGTNYQLSFVPPSGDHMASGTTSNFSLACNNSNTQTVTVGAASGYSCTDDACCPAGGSAPYLVPVYPSVVYLSDGFGTVTLTLSGGVGTGYSGSATRSTTNTYTVVGGSCTLGGGGSVTVNFTLKCGVGGWHLIISIAGGCHAPGPGPTKYPGPTGTFVGLTRDTTIGSLSSCPPSLAVSVSESFSSSFDGDEGYQAMQVYGGGATFDISQ